MSALTAECRDCDGAGVIYGKGYPADDLDWTYCLHCDAIGEITCDRGGINCPFGRCYCEEAWEREQQSKMEEF
jgi:hypothetical protein